MSDTLRDVLAEAIADHDDICSRMAIPECSDAIIAALAARNVVLARGASGACVRSQLGGHCTTHDAEWPMDGLFRCPAARGDAPTPTRDEFQRMSAAQVNDFLESRGLTVRVIEDALAAAESPDTRALDERLLALAIDKAAAQDHTAERTYWPAIIAAEYVRLAALPPETGRG